MPVEVIMPKVDMDMAAGRIAAWHVAEGEAVTKGQAIFDIETDKATMEVESPGTGAIANIAAAEGAEVAIGEPVAWVYGEGEEVGPPPGGARRAADARAATQQGACTRESVHKSLEENENEIQDARAAAIRATPAARRVARESGLALAGIAGSGPRGRIGRADAERARDAERTRETDALAAETAAAGTAGGSELSVLRAGEGTAAPILFLHGFANDGHSWAPVEAHLVGGRVRLKLELPGHGRSPHRAPRDFDALMGEVGAAVDGLDAPRLHLVGHSLGGAVALALAERRPERAASLTLIAPAGLGPEIAGETIAGITRAERAESLAPWLKRLVADPEAISGNFVAAAMQARAAPELRAAQARMAEALFPDGTQAIDVAAALGRVGCPLRLIWGRADGVLPWRHALRAPGRAALHLLPATGHLPHVEAPELVAALIAASIGAAERSG